MWSVFSPRGVCMFSPGSSSSFQNSNDSFHVLERALLRRQTGWSSCRKMNPWFYTYKYSVARLHLMNTHFDHPLQNGPKRPFISSLRASCCARLMWMLMLPTVHILICTHVQSFIHTHTILSTSQMHVLSQLISQLIHNQMWHFLSILPSSRPFPPTPALLSHPKISVCWTVDSPCKPQAN